MPIDLSRLDGMQAALGFHRERHAVLAGNVANLDTPGYRPVDLLRETTEAGAPMAVTDAQHMAAPGGGTYVTAFDDGGALTGSDGNAVSLEREMSKIDANRTRYSTVSELVSRKMAMLRYAAGDGT